jgi:ankyrin repeat protein
MVYQALLMLFLLAARDPLKAAAEAALRRPLIPKPICPNEQLINSVKDMRHYAGSWDTRDLVALLAKGLVNVDTPCHRNGRTALHEACNARKNVAATELLLAAGADVNAIDGWGNTPLHLACMQGDATDPLSKPNYALIELLIRWGANKDACNKINRTPLIEACLNKPHPSAAIIQLLVSRKSINVADFLHGTTALISFCKEGTRNIPFGAYTDLPGYHRLTKDSFDALIAILAASPNTEQKDSYRNTAMWYARRRIAIRLLWHTTKPPVPHIRDITAEEDVALEHERFAPKPSCWSCCSAKGVRR